ncbi:MAG TPA: hypothetical protein VGS57_15775 [Thermoanaerobaculia bacterium]|jgi:hypothetical protein|nr:hypothetical protein [Thermoanaerobaculia bacterium]
MSARSERRQPAHDEGSEGDGSRDVRGGPAPRGEPARREPTPSGALTGIDVRAPLGDSPGGALLRLRRRDLLAWGGAAALLPALARPARAQEALTGAADVVRPMSVGFVDGSETWRRYRGIAAAALNRGIRSEAGRPPEPARVVPATSLIAGQQELANELVEVRIHGLYPIPNPTSVRNAYVTVYFPSDEPARRRQPLPFTAWGYHSRPAPDPAAPIRFVAPLGADGALDFLLEAAPAPNNPFTRRPSSLLSPSVGPIGGRFSTSFTVDWFAGRPRLQRGVYLLGLAPDTWSSERELPMPKAGQTRPVELLSLMVSFEPVERE